MNSDLNHTLCFHRLSGCEWPVDICTKDARIYTDDAYCLKWITWLIHYCCFVDQLYNFAHCVCGQMKSVSFSKWSCLWQDVLFFTKCKCYSNSTVILIIWICTFLCMLLLWFTVISQCGWPRHFLNSVNVHCSNRSDGIYTSFLRSGSIGLFLQTAGQAYILL